MAKLKDGYYKQLASSIGSDNYLLLAGGGHKILTDFWTKDAFNPNDYLLRTGGTITGDLTTQGALNARGITLNDCNGAADSYWQIYGWDNELQFTKRNSAGTHLSNVLTFNYDSMLATFASNVKASSFTIGANAVDVPQRYVCLYGKTGTSYLNIGYAAGDKNCAELSFQYAGSGSNDNAWGLGMYGAHGYLRSTAGGGLTYNGNTVWHAGNLTGNQTGHGHQYLNTCGRLTQEANSSRASGMRFYEIYGNGYPFAYGNLLQLNGINGVSQLAMQWYGNEIYYRSAPDTSTTFNSWARLWSSTNFNPDNYISKASTNRPGVTRVYRNDYDSHYNVRINWQDTFDGYRWVWKGYAGDSYHGECYVDRAGKANSANSASSSSYLSSNEGGVSNALQYWQSTGDSKNPSSDWWYSLRMSHGNSSDYFHGQISMSFFNDDVKFRRLQGGSAQNWRTFWHDGNLDPSYLRNLLTIDTNSRHVKFGCQNSGHAHYETNADISHWFNKRVDVVDRIGIYNYNTYMNSNGFYKHGSNDNYVLLGGGGHRSVNDFLNSVDSTQLIVQDIRSQKLTPTTCPDQRLCAYFSDNEGVNGRHLAGILSLKGWTSTGYTCWQLAGNGTTSDVGTGLKYREGIGSAFGPWNKIWTEKDFMYREVTHLVTRTGYISEWNIKAYQVGKIVVISGYIKTGGGYGNGTVMMNVAAEIQPYAPTGFIQLGTWPADVQYNRGILMTLYENGQIKVTHQNASANSYFDVSCAYICK